MEPESELMKIRFLMMRRGSAGGAASAWIWVLGAEGEGGASSRTTSTSAYWGPFFRERRADAHMSGPVALVVRCFWKVWKDLKSLLDYFKDIESEGIWKEIGVFWLIWK